MTVSLIAAMALNRTIGCDGGLPWNLPADLKRFRERTTGHVIIMGRKTHESIGRPLPGRTNVVLSRRAGYTAAGCVVARDLDGALEQARDAGETEAFVIGGAAIYEQALAHADRIYLTQVHADVPGDVFFPPLEASTWREVEREEHPADQRHAHRFAFTVLERI